MDGLCTRWLAGSFELSRARGLLRTAIQELRAGDG
jgi:hypothetical protein